MNPNIRKAGADLLVASLANDHDAMERAVRELTDGMDLDDMGHVLALESFQAVLGPVRVLLPAMAPDDRKADLPRMIRIAADMLATADLARQASEARQAAEDGQRG